MKKNLVMIVAAALMAGLLGGCGNAESNQESNTETTAEAGISLEKMDVDKYVTLGEYKGLAVTVEEVPVTDSEVETSALDAYNRNVTAENGGIVDRAVEVGDTVNIDFEGKEDGVAFEGGTAQSQSLTIGSGKFIPGFEDGLVGVMPGETVDLNLTFPEDYNPEMAGKEVVFTVNVNFIQPTEMRDEVVANFGLEGVTNVEEFMQAARKSVEQQAVEYYNKNLENEVLEAFMNACEFKDIPQEMTDKYAAVVRDQITSQAAMYGMEADQFAQAAYGMDLETLVKEFSVAGAKQDIALQAVANRENLNISKEELDTILQEAATAGGFKTVEEFLGENTPENYRDYFVIDKAMQFLVDNAKVTAAE